MRHARFVIFASLFLTFGCASLGMNSVQRLNQLSPGMTSDEVIEVLGEPESSEMTEDKWVLKYTLHENWKGHVPYFVVFDRKSQTLLSWHEDEEGYQRNQEQLGNTFQPLLENAGGGGNAKPVGPNDPDLQRWITGNYYSFSSSAVVSASSERSLTLCVNGQFRAAGEFSASGNRDSGGNTDWGAASQGGEAGAWTISGDRQSGTITLSYPGGSTRNVEYRVGSQQEQTMYFDGRQYAYAGEAVCR